MLELTSGRARVTIAPERGGSVTRFDVDEQRVLFMDDDTLHDATKNVRGGVPVLFPSPGKLTNDAWSRAGRRGSMKQHGFARNLPWRTAGPRALRLESTDVTRAQFPWDFTLDMTFSLHDLTLRLDQRVTNRSSTPMPFGLGFHPYFQVPDGGKSAARIETRARRAFDNVTKAAIDLAGIDLTQREVDLHLLDHGSTESALVHPGGEVRLRGSEEYTHWVVWTLAGRDFVCLEPWTCPGDALNSGDRLILLEPAESRDLFLEMSFSR
jgi:galactose mutarotase-like enzyme